MGRVDAQSGRDGTRQRGGIRYRRELHPAHPLRIHAAPRVQQMLRQQRFADATRSDDAHQTVTVDERAERIGFVDTPE